MASASAMLTFRDVALQRAVYESLDDDVRAAGHRAVAVWLEANGDGDPRGLAEQWIRSGDRAAAGTWRCRVAEQSLEAGDLAAVVAEVEAAVLDGASGELRGAMRLLQAEAHRLQREPERAERCAKEAILWITPGSPLWFHAAAQVSMATAALGHQDRLVGLAEVLRGATREGEGEPAQLLSLAQTAADLAAGGHPYLADTLLERLAEAEPRLTEEDAWLAARIHRARALRARYAGDVAQQLVHAEAAATTFDRAGAPHATCAMRLISGRALRAAGAWAEAERVLRRSLAEAEGLELAEVVASAEGELGVVRARCGDIDEGLRRGRAAIEGLTALGDVRQQCAVHTAFASVHFDRGALEEAAAEVRSALRLASASKASRAHALSVLSQIHLARGAPEDALAAARDAYATLEELGALEEGEARIRLAHAEALDASGETERARVIISAARSRLVQLAGRFTKLKLGASFLEDVPENARTLARAREWGVTAQRASS